MNMRIILPIIAALLTSASYLSSCSLLSKTEPLTQRQIEILQKESLPTEYNELRFSQKIAIGGIEDMLTYLERKYPNERFEYVNYTSSSYMEQEHIVASCQYGDVIVYRYTADGKYWFEDDFEEVKLSARYTSQMDDLIAKYTERSSYLVYSRVLLSDNENLSDDDMLLHYKANTIVFVKKSQGENEFRKHVEEISEYFTSNYKGGYLFINYMQVTDNNLSPILIQYYYGDTLALNIQSEYHYTNCSGKADIQKINQ